MFWHHVWCAACGIFTLVFLVVFFACVFRAPFAFAVEEWLCCKFPNATNFLKGCSKAAEVLSLGSVVISLIFANLDKQVLGLYLRDLISAFFPGYFFVFAITLAATLLCLGTAEWGKLSMVLPLLVVIILCCAVHLHVLYHLMFRTGLRRQHALREWNRNIAAAETPSRAVELAYGVANAIIAEPTPYGTAVSETDELNIHDCFARAIMRMTELSSGTERKESFERMSSAWAYMLRQNPPREKLLFMLRCALRRARANAAPSGDILLGFFCALYLYTVEQLPFDSDCGLFLNRLQHLVVEFSDALKPYSREVWHYLYSAYVLAVLFHREIGEINMMSHELLYYVPMYENDPGYSTLGNEADLFGDMFHVLFEDADIRAHLPKCIHMLTTMNQPT